MAKEYEKIFKKRQEEGVYKVVETEIIDKPKSPNAAKTHRQIVSEKLDKDLDHFKENKKASGVKTKKQLDLLRKQLSIQANVAKMNKKHLQSHERLANRENSLFRLADQSNRKTFTKVKKARMLKDYLHELKNNENYKKNHGIQRFKGCIGFSKSQRKRFRLDLDRINTARNMNEIPQDPFKTHRVIKTASMSRNDGNLAISPNSIKIEKYKGETRKGNFVSTSDLRKVESGFKTASNFNSDVAPLFSSFSETGFFTLETD